jgi:hypothetical protein
MIIGLNSRVLLKYKLLVPFKLKKMQMSKLIESALLIIKLKLLLIKHRKKPWKLSVCYRLRLANNMLLKRKPRRLKRKCKNKQQNKQRKQSKRLQLKLKRLQN